MAHVAVRRFGNTKNIRMRRWLQSKMSDEQTRHVCKNGTVHHYFKGRLHREDGPAVEKIKGGEEWWFNGKLHREGGPAVTSNNGYKAWHIDGQLHREDGPAVEYAGSEKWFKNGKLHREDGPAIEDADGNKEWWINGKKISETEWFRKVVKSWKK